MSTSSSPFFCRKSGASEWTNFQPRLGFAYSSTKDCVPWRVGKIFLGNDRPVEHESLQSIDSAPAPQ